MTDVIAKSPATIEDLRKVPKDGQTYELVDGAIIVTPAGMRHSGAACRSCGWWIPNDGPSPSIVLQDAVEYAGDAILTAEPVLPGFSCRASEFFPA